MNYGLLHNMESNFLLSLNNASVVSRKKYLLKELNFHIKRNEFVTIVGKNGSGKSTLCKVLTGNLKISTGTMKVQDNIKISYVPQHNNHNNIIPIKVLDFLLLNNVKKKLNELDYKLIEKLKATSLLQQQFSELSGGQKQRIILTRALILKPDLLILDEPVSFIDFASKDGIYALIQEIRTEQNFSVIMVSHDLNIVLNNTDRVVCIKNGQIGCEGKPNDDPLLEFLINNNWTTYKHHD